MCRITLNALNFSSSITLTLECIPNAPLKLPSYHSYTSFWKTMNCIILSFLLTTFFLLKKKIDGVSSLCVFFFFFFFDMHSFLLIFAYPLRSLTHLFFFPLNFWWILLTDLLTMISLTASGRTKVVRSRTGDCPLFEIKEQNNWNRKSDPVTCTSHKQEAGKKAGLISQKNHLNGN